MHSGFLSKLQSFIETRLEDIDEASHLLIKNSRITLRERWLQDTVEEFIAKESEIRSFPRDVQVSLNRDKSATIPLAKLSSNGEMDLFLSFPDEKFLVMELKLICKGRLFDSEKSAKSFAENDVDNLSGFTLPTSQNLFSFTISTGRSKESICLIRKDSIWTHDTTVGVLETYATKQARVYADSIYKIGQLDNRTLTGKDIYYCSIVVAGLHVHVSHVGKADGHTYEIVKLTNNTMTDMSNNFISQPFEMTPNKKREPESEHQTPTFLSVKQNSSSLFDSIGTLPIFPFTTPRECDAVNLVSTLSISNSVNSPPAFSFGKPNDSVNSPLAFSFGKPSDSVNSPPAFSFGKTSDSANSPPSAISFGKPSNSVNSPPAFSFGKPNDSVNLSPHLSDTFSRQLTFSKQSDLVDSPSTASSLAKQNDLVYSSTTSSPLTNRSIDLGNAPSTPSSTTQNEKVDSPSTFSFGKQTDTTNSLSAAFLTKSSDFVFKSPIFSFEKSNDSSSLLTKENDSLSSSSTASSLTKPGDNVILLSLSNSNTASSNSVRSTIPKSPVVSVPILPTICTRCKRDSHTFKSCYASTNIFGHELPTFCTRCKRDSHLVNACYATYYESGYRIDRIE